MQMIRRQLGGRFEIKRQYNYGFFSRMNSDQTFSMTDEHFIRSLNELIDANISDPGFTDVTISEKLGIALPSLISKMQGLLGTDMAGYLLRIRVIMVKDRLTNTEEEPETIAQKAGFADVQSMNTAFKNETGKTVDSIRKE